MAGLCLLALATSGQLGVAGLVALVAFYTFTRGLVVPLATAAALACGLVAEGAMPQRRSGKMNAQGTKGV